MPLQTRIAALALLLTLSALGGVCLAQDTNERISTARRTGEITVYENEHLFALGRVLLGNDLARVNQFRKDVVRLNPALGAGGEKIMAGMRLKLPEYIAAGETAAPPSREAKPAPALTAGPPAQLASPVQTQAPAAIAVRAPPVAILAAEPAMPAINTDAARASAGGAASDPVTQAGTSTAPVHAADPSIPVTATSSTAAVAPLSPARPAETPTIASPAAPDAQALTGEQRVSSFDVTVNGAKAGSWIFLERDSKLYTTRDAFEEWRVLLPSDTPGLRFRGDDYYALSAVRDFRSRINYADQSIELVFSPQSFAATRLTQEIVKKPVVGEVLPSAFFNYDLNLSRSEQRGTPRTNGLGMLAEIGASTKWGILTSSSAGRNLTGDVILGDSRKWIRLETTFTKDFPEENRTLRLGDTRSQGGMLGRDVYFGGIQYGTNFALSPGFVTNPLPILNGSSAAQSTVELYVNDVLRQTSSVPAGPFTLDRLPGLTGSGEARLVVRDILGRETVIVQPFFTSTRLLAQGLSDWRVEAGNVRRDLGTKDGNYGPGFVNGAFRHGVTDRITVEGAAAGGANLRNIGVGSVLTLPLRLLGKAGLSLSEDRRLGSGNQWLLGVERQTDRGSLALQMQAATINYRQLGQAIDISPVKQQLAGNWSYATTDWGSFGIGFAHVRQYDDTQVKTVSANYSIRVGERANLSVTASQALTGSSSASVGMTLLVPLGNNIISTAAVTRTNGREAFHVSTSKTPAQDENLGWRVLAGRERELDRLEGGVTYQGQYGRVSGDIAQSPTQTSTRLGAVGGLLLADGRLFASRRVDQSFAIAEVAGYGNVGVGVGNSMLARTDGSGVALVPNLAPYQNNQIRLDAKDLPVSAEVDSIEQIAVPAYRSGVKVTFPVRSGRGALLKIVLDDGEPAPVGAIARITGDNQEFYVARRGEAFVTGLQTGSSVTLEWKEARCTFEVVLPAETPDDIPRVGPLSCKGVPR